MTVLRGVRAFSAACGPAPFAGTHATALRHFDAQVKRARRCYAPRDGGALSHPLARRRRHLGADPGPRPSPDLRRPPGAGRARAVRPRRGELRRRHRRRRAGVRLHALGDRCAVRRRVGAGRDLRDAGALGADSQRAARSRPEISGVVEARANDVRAEDIIALSIGTGSVILPPEADDVRPPLAAPRGASGTVHDLKAVAGAILDDPPDAATFIAHTLLGQPLGRDPEHPVTGGALVRVSPLVQPVRGADGGWTLPRGLGEDEFARLTELELDAIDPGDIALLQRFCDAWLAGHVPNQPIRANRQLQCEIGFASVPAAAAHWKKLAGL